MEALTEWPMKLPCKALSSVFHIACAGKQRMENGLDVFYAFILTLFNNTHTWGSRIFMPM